MGAWGVGPFDDEGATDLIASIRHDDDLAVSIGVPPHRIDERGACPWRSDQP